MKIMKCYDCKNKDYCLGSDFLMDCTIFEPIKPIKPVKNIKLIKK